MWIYVVSITQYGQFATGVRCKVTIDAAVFFFKKWLHILVVVLKVESRMYDQFLTKMNESIVT